MCERCAELEERVAWLEGELGLSALAERAAALSDAFGVTPAEGLVLGRLYGAKGRIVTDAQLEEACPPRDEASDRDPKIVRVYVSRLRNKLGRPAIENLWGQGYRLTAEAAARVAAALGETAA